MELLGGEPGTAYVASDTDEHDEVILLHELGHLVMDLMSARSSYGGRHPPGVLLDPGLAWEEGRVSWFATAVLGNSLYRDTVGFEPRGSLRVDRDYAQTHQGPQGMGSEETVAEILWDLADGTPGLPDDDNDGVALGPVVLMQAMMDLADLPEGYPSLPSFLRLLVSTGRVEERDLQRMLAATGQPDDLVPPQDRIPWPMELTVPGKAWGTVDGLSQPCPSGGAPSPRVGQDAVKVYRFHLSEPDVVDILVRIYGTGRRRERQDLDLELRDARTRLLHSSRTQRRQERLRGISLPAGWYVMIVRDAGQGNRARYDVRISSHRVHR
jgi:hypothetical protein